MDSWPSGIDAIKLFFDEAIRAGLGERDLNALAPRSPSSAFVRNRRVTVC